MAKLYYKANSNTSLKKKPRVYFTCHPNDYELYFDKITNDILKINDCAIYYTSDMSAELTDENLSVDLGQMNLFAVPITKKLLTEPNRAMMVDIAFAKQEGISILPFVMEDGIDDIYALPEAFDKLQYLKPYSADATEINYELKLKRYLDSVLISDEMSERIRAAFDAYIFLSYRKKDRVYANQLMRLIHGNPKFRDIAIWYDEFLTPGESFEESIKKALDNSKLFALLVTPNILEKNNGKPNFVMAEEYPAALRANKTVVPAEMVKTDKEELAKCFKDIPECVDPSDEEKFRERLIKAIKKVAISTNDRNPEHLFLIGLAYLDGIDVEVDRERGEKLITRAAESDLFEAMLKLYNIYSSSAGVYNKNRAIKWAERMYEYCLKNNGNDDINTARCAVLLAKAYERVYENLKAAKYAEIGYDIARKVLGEEDDETLGFLYYMSNFSEKPEQKASVYEKIYKIKLKKYGEEHEDTLAMLGSVASAFNLYKGGHAKAIELYKKLYFLTNKVYGEKHGSTISSLKGLIKAINFESFSYWEYKPADGGGGYKNKELEIYEKEGQWFIDNVGIEHPCTIELLTIRARNCFKNGDVRWYELFEMLLGICSGLYGERSENALGMMLEWAKYCVEAKNDLKADELFSRVYEAYLERYGEKDGTLVALLIGWADRLKNNESYEASVSYYERAYSLVKAHKISYIPGLFDTDAGDPAVMQASLMISCLDGIVGGYMGAKKYSEAIPYCENLYKLYKKAVGDNGEQTLTVKHRLAHLYARTEDYKTAAKIFEQTSAARDILLGKNDESSISSRNYLAYCYKKLGKLERAAELYESVYNSRAITLGARREDTFDALCDAAASYKSSGKENKAIAMLEEYMTVHKPGKDRTTTILEDLVPLYEKVNEFKKAAEVLERLYGLYSSAKGKKHEKTLTSLHNSAYFYSQAGMHEKAGELYEAVYSLKVKAYGEEDKSTYLTMANLAFEYMHLCRYSEAVALYERVYAFRVSAFGADDSRTIKIKERMAEAKEKLYDALK